MAKRNKGSKKRQKRQLMKRVAKVNQVAKTPAVKTSAKKKLAIGPKIEASKYADNNKLYQIALDKKYGAGTVTAKERYISQRAVLLHFCSKCGQEFYGKPSYMLGKDHQKHICSMPYGSNSGERLQQASSTKYKTKKKSQDISKRFYNMVIEDFTPKEIAKELGIPLSIVNEYFKVEGLI